MSVFDPESLTPQSETHFCKDMMSMCIQFPLMLIKRCPTPLEWVGSKPSCERSPSGLMKGMWCSTMGCLHSVLRRFSHHGQLASKSFLKAHWCDWSRIDQRLPSCNQLHSLKGVWEQAKDDIEQLCIVCTRCCISYRMV